MPRAVARSNLGRADLNRRPPDPVSGMLGLFSEPCATQPPSLIHLELSRSEEDRPDVGSQEPCGVGHVVAHARPRRVRSAELLRTSTNEKRPTWGLQCSTTCWHAV